MVEFITNNKNFAFIRLFLFFVLKGLHLFIRFDIVNLLNTTTKEQIYKKKAIDISKSI